MDTPALTERERVAALRMINAAREPADRALTYIVNRLDDVKSGTKVYARRHRIKTEQGIEDKVHFKRVDPVEPKPWYTWKDITDIVGLRFITLYRDDVADVTEIVLKCLLALNDEKCPFVRSELTEFKLYMSNTTAKHNPLAKRVAELAARLREDRDKWDVPEPILSQEYSSVHFVTWMPTGNDPAKVPIEIQVRSVFEDAWGEVDHALLYEHRRTGAPLDLGLQQVQSHLHALKKMMDAAADFADAIRHLRSPEVPPAYPIKPAIDGTGYNERVCNMIGVPAAVTQALKTLAHRREELDEAIRRKETTVSLADYISYADQFEDLLDDQLGSEGFLSDAEKGTEPRELFYLMRMEEAVCRLLSADEKQVLTAIALFREVVDEFPNHPVAWLRLGEAYARLLDIQDWGTTSSETVALGESAYQHVVSAIPELHNLTERARYFAASDTQEAYIRDHLARLRAYLMWRAENRSRGASPPNEDSYRIVRQAAQLTYSAVGSVSAGEARDRLLNSLVYFAAEAADLATRLSLPDPLPCPKEELRRFLGELEATAPRQGQDALRVWDSLAYARWMFDGRKAARTAAASVMVAYRDLMAGPQRSLAEYVREQEARAVARGLQILGIGDD
jgi:ppGpp synthetase/RelA/SpoT-type nucleotidyltranferase